MELRDLTLSEISVGDTISFSRTWTNEDVNAFAELSGDKSPLHTDDEYAATTKFGKRLVHGMLLGAACSAFVGMYLPGRRCLDLRQSLSFRKPVFIGDTTLIEGTVIGKSVSTGVITIAITFTKEGTLIAESEALVQVLS